MNTNDISRYYQIATEICPGTTADDGLRETVIYIPADHIIDRLNAIVGSDPEDHILAKSVGFRGKGINKTVELLDGMGLQGVLRIRLINPFGVIVREQPQWCVMRNDIIDPVQAAVNGQCAMCTQHEMWALDDDLYHEDDALLFADADAVSPDAARAALMCAVDAI